ncbi:MAG: DUF6398 domain-containing protein [Deltaproteobacteria bacterium]|jgi:hypothetical protein|nr:DUF6398 domain-containing protein [Deltaproteobacteria bacterium]
MAAKYNEIARIIIEFSSEFLDDEYKSLNLAALAKLCRKRPSPVVKGKDHNWAAGIVCAIGSINFLFDKEQPVSISRDELASWFGLSKSTISYKAREIKNILNLSYFSSEFLSRRILEKSSYLNFFKLGNFIFHKT